MIQTKDNRICSTYFIYCFLKAFQEKIYKLQTGAGQPHVYSKDLEILNIPLPSIAMQREICKEVESRLIKAEELKKQAAEIVENAKKEVGKMLFEGK